MKNVCRKGVVIFSTYVEMNRGKKFVTGLQDDFLYVCGDEPKAVPLEFPRVGFSLRMWR